MFQTGKIVGTWPPASARGGRSRGRIRFDLEKFRPRKFLGAHGHRPRPIPPPPPPVLKLAYPILLAAFGGGLGGLNNLLD